MKKIIFLALGFACMDYAWAGSNPPALDFSSDISYELSPSSEAEKVMTNLDQTFKQRRYTALKADGSSRVESLDWLNRIYISRDNKGVIFVKAGLIAKGTVIMDKPYRHEKGFVFHTKQKDGRVWAFFFTGMSLDASQGLFNQIKKDTRVASLWDLAINSAFADEMSTLCSSSPVQSDSSGGATSVVKSAWGCLKGAGFGVWDATGGFVVDAWHAGKYVVTHSPSETWSQISGQWDKMVQVVGNLSDSLGKFKTQFNGLDPSIKAQVICETAATIGTGVLAAYLTMGTSTPELLTALSKSMAKVAEKTGSGTLAGMARGVATSSTKLQEAVDAIKASGPAGREYDEAMRDWLKANNEMGKIMARNPSSEEIDAWGEELRIAGRKEVNAQLKAKAAMKNFDASMEGKALLMDKSKRAAVAAYAGVLGCKVQGSLNPTVESVAPQVTQ